MDTKVASEQELFSKLAAKTGAQTLKELSDKVFMAIKPGWFSGKVFRPGVPAKFLRFAMAQYDGKPQPCVILEYVNSLNGSKLEHAHPTKDMFTSLEFIPATEVTLTYAPRKLVEKGFR
jgi:hypothetical protein